MRIDNRILLVSEIKNKVRGLSHRMMEIGWFVLPSEEVRSNKARFEEFCKNECVNYGNNGGCPPYAPDFDRLRKIYSNTLIVWIREPVQELPEILVDKAVNSNTYFIAHYIHGVLPPIARHIITECRDLWKPDMILGESTCKSCKPCAFDTIKGEGLGKCNNPKERFYSLESTGIDVDLTMRVGSFSLEWFKLGKAAAYTTKAVAFLYKGEFPDTDFTYDLCTVLNKRKGWKAISLMDLLM